MVDRKFTFGRSPDGGNTRDVVYPPVGRTPFFSGPTSGRRSVGFHSTRCSLVLPSVSSIESSFLQLRQSTMLFIK